MNYYNGYFLEICSAVAETCVTNGTRQEIDQDEGLKIFAEKVEAVKKAGGLIFFCGNGASCSMAEHMSHDFFQNAVINTQTCAETAHITAISNDVSYEQVFAYRIDRLLSERDMLVTISSSGNSPNVIEGIKAAKKNGAFVVTFSGKQSDNKSCQLGDLNFYVPLATYGLVESAHAGMLHCCLDYYLDKYMEGKH